MSIVDHFCFFGCSDKPTLHFHLNFWALSLIVLILGQSLIWSGITLSKFVQVRLSFSFLALLLSERIIAISEMSSPLCALPPLQIFQDDKERYKKSLVKTWRKRNTELKKHKLLNCCHYSLRYVVSYNCVQLAHWAMNKN